MGKLFKLVCNKTGYYNIFATYESDLAKCMEKLLSWYNYMDTKEGVEDILLGIMEYEPYFHIIKLGDYKLESMYDFENSEYDNEELENIIKKEIDTEHKCINRLDYADMRHFEEKMSERIN
jgi:hypothetical protein